MKAKIWLDEYQRWFPLGEGSKHLSYDTGHGVAFDFVVEEVPSITKSTLYRNKIQGVDTLVVGSEIFTGTFTCMDPSPEYGGYWVTLDTK